MKDGREERKKERKEEKEIRNGFLIFSSFLSSVLYM